MVVSRGSFGCCILGDEGPRVKLFLLGRTDYVPGKPTYSTWFRRILLSHKSLLGLLFWLCFAHRSASLELRDLRNGSRMTAAMSRSAQEGPSRHTLRRSVGDGGPELTEESEALRSVSFFGPSGMAGVVLSPKTRWVCVAYFWWNGEGIPVVCW